MSLRRFHFKLDNSVVLKLDLDALVLKINYLYVCVKMQHIKIECQAGPSKKIVINYKKCTRFLLKT